MAIKTFATGEVLTASDTNTYLANSGLVYVTSTTVGTAVSSVTVSNCFSSTYDNYRIIVANSTCTNIDLLRFTLASRTGNTYNYANPYYAYSVASAYHAAQNAAYASIALTGTKWSTVIELQSPNLATTATWTFANSTETYTYFGGGYSSSTTASTGFTFTSTGTMTGGTITVYGYRKA